jgi:hypothetical protein
MVTKKHPDALRENKILNQAKREVPGFEELLDRFERTFRFWAEAKVLLITIRAMLQLSRFILVKSQPN